MMGEERLNDIFIRFIDGLSEAEVRDQLRLAYLQMERCISILKGDDAEPVAMKDNGLSSDLELYYACVKAVDGDDDGDEIEICYDPEDGTVEFSGLDDMSSFSISAERLEEYIKTLKGHGEED